MDTSLVKKINNSVELIRSACSLAVSLSDDGFIVGFSGGKDSQVVYELAKMASVKFRAVYNVTTIDHADTIRFIRTEYPMVEFLEPAESFISMVQRKGLPTQLKRWCCERFKERSFPNHVVITGVRRDESVRRSRYTSFAQVKNGKFVDIDSIEHICLRGKDKIMLHPILEWTERDVWQFINENGLSVNPVYSRRKRVGCCVCPFASKRELNETKATMPKFWSALEKAVGVYLARSGNTNFKDGNECLAWWISKESYKSFKAKQNQLEFPAFRQSS